MINKKGFVITTYQQIKLLEENINNLKEFNNFKDSPIVVVSTSEDDVGMAEIIKKFDNVYLIEWKDAPFPGHLNLPYRILMSIQKGLIKIKELGVNKALHLHSDTFWFKNKENNLIKLFNLLSNKMIIGDLCIVEETLSDKRKTIPNRVHLHPEGLFFNLNICEQYGFGFTFDQIWNKKSDFKSHNYKSPEALLGQYAIYCIHKRNHITYDNTIGVWMSDLIHINEIRDYHGLFDSGLWNKKVSQNIK